MLSILTFVTGALFETCFSSENVTAFLATKDLFLILSSTSTNGIFSFKSNFSLTFLVITIL